MSTKSERVASQVIHYREEYQLKRKKHIPHSLISMENPEIEIEALAILQQEYDGPASPPADQDISKEKVPKVPKAPKKIAEQTGIPKEPKESMKVKPTLGNWLQWARFHRGITRQNFVMNLTNINVARLMIIENDEELPTIDELLELQRALKYILPEKILGKHPEFKSLIPA